MLVGSAPLGMASALREGGKTVMCGLLLDLCPYRVRKGFTYRTDDAHLLERLFAWISVGLFTAVGPVAGIRGEALLRG